MLFPEVSAQEKRANFRKELASGKLLRFPGAFSPIVSRLIEEKGYDGIYISGAVLSADLALPDIGLTNQAEVIGRGRAIARVTKLPSLIDIDTGFGEPMNACRTIQELEELGISGCHIEDQVNPKRCGHLDNKEVVDTATMVRRIKGAESGRKDSNFLIMARTDAKAIEGLDKAIDRAKAYIDAGADAIFPEALHDQKEFEKFRKEISVPILSNMTEFGKSKLLTTKELENLGVNIVIYPVTTLRIALHAVENALESISEQGTQEPLLDQMQHRKRLYKVLQYERYNQFDQGIFNFKLESEK